MASHHALTEHQCTVHRASSAYQAVRYRPLSQQCTTTRHQRLNHDVAQSTSESGTDDDSTKSPREVCRHTRTNSSNTFRLSPAMRTRVLSSIETSCTVWASTERTESNNRSAPCRCPQSSTWRPSSPCHRTGPRQRRTVFVSCQRPVLRIRAEGTGRHRGSVMDLRWLQEAGWWMSSGALWSKSSTSAGW